MKTQKGRGKESVCAKKKKNRQQRNTLNGANEDITNDRYHHTKKEI
jgi:hypothetical protein